MSIASAIGLSSDRKVRYGIVGLGDIAQEAMLPGVAHTGNSVITAFVSGDTDKARKVAEKYDVDAIHAYEQFGELLASGTIDALYIATPNWRHAEFVIPALEAGIHVLVEKPLEVSSDKARAILTAEAASTARLMVAYRLHFEPATLDTLKRIGKGEIGQTIAFSSLFAQMVDPANHRTKNGVLAGPLLDMGPYPINAARYCFDSEPSEVVSAVATRHPEAGLGDIDDTVAVILRFPGERLAQFTVSYFANAIDSFFVAGTKGSIQMNPGFTFGKGLEQHIVLGAERSHETHKATDQFGGEMRYFSDCILHDRAPEPNGEEGFADVRVIEGILRCLETGQPQTLEPFVRRHRIDPIAQEERLKTKKAPELVGAASPARSSQS